MHKIAFIVNTFNRPKSILLECLESIHTQIRNDNTILVVDQNPVPVISDSPFYHVIHCPDKCISVARNTGARSVDSQWYVFVDDDGILKEGSIRELITFLNLESPDIVGGKIEIRESCSLYSVRQNIKSGPLSFIFLNAVMGGLIAIRRETFAELGGFDERFGIGSFWGSGEESDFTIRAYLKGKKVCFLSEFILLHPSPAEMSDEKIQSYAMGKGAILKKHIKSGFQFSLLYELMDVFLLPIAEGFISLFTFNRRRLKTACLKFTYRWKGFRKFN